MPINFTVAFIGKNYEIIFFQPTQLIRLGSPPLPLHLVGWMVSKYMQPTCLLRISAFKPR